MTMSGGHTIGIDDRAYWHLGASKMPGFLGYLYAHGKALPAVPATPTESREERRVEELLILNRKARAENEEMHRLLEARKGGEGRLAWLEEALAAPKGSGRRRIAEEGVRLVDLLLRKNADYGSSAWQVPILEPTLPARTAILVRMSDKIARIARLINIGGGEAQCDETIEDTIRDLAGYCLLYLSAP